MNETKGTKIEGIATITDHTKDSDCTLDDAGMCIMCHVIHAEPCPECAQRGYHRDNCSEIG